LLSKHQQQGTTEVATAHLWASPGYRNPHGRTLESRRSFAALQGGFYPPYNCVINPMSDKGITYGAIGGAINP